MFKVSKKEYYTRYDVLSILNNIKIVIEIGKVDEGLKLMEMVIKELKD